MSESVLNGQRFKAGHLLISVRCLAGCRRRSSRVPRTPESQIAQVGLLLAHRGLQAPD